MTFFVANQTKILPKSVAIMLLEERGVVHLSDEKFLFTTLGIG